MELSLHGQNYSLYTLHIIWPLRVKKTVLSYILSYNLALAVYGGVPYDKQEQMLSKGTDVVVGTPGRMKDLINKGILKFNDLKVVTLDEVDRMLDMGFADDVDMLIGECYNRGKNPQTLFFSATCPQWVKGKYLAFY